MFTLTTNELTSQSSCVYTVRKLFKKTTPLKRVVEVISTSIGTYIAFTVIVRAPQKVRPSPVPQVLLTVSYIWYCKAIV